MKIQAIMSICLLNTAFNYLFIYLFGHPLCVFAFCLYKYVLDERLNHKNCKIKSVFLKLHLKSLMFCSIYKDLNNSHEVLSSTTHNALLLALHIETFLHLKFMFCLV